MSPHDGCNICNFSPKAAYGFALLLALIFLLFCATTLTGTSNGFDQTVFSWLVQLKRGSLGVAWLVELARDITALGSITVLVLLSLSFTGLLAVMGRAFLAVYLILVVAGALCLSSLLKLIIARARPQDNLHLTEVFSSSFPSAHALHSTAVYLSAGWVLSLVLASASARRYVIGLALMFPLLIGLSRVYLGVHWPVDIAAGWAAGGSWALLCAGFAKARMQSRVSAK